MPHHIVPDGTVVKTKLVEEPVTVDKITLIKCYVTDVGNAQYVCDYSLAYKDVNGNVIETVNGILTMDKMSLALLNGIHNLEGLVLADIQTNAGVESGSIVDV